MLLENGEKSKCVMEQQKRFLNFLNLILIKLILIGSKALDKIKRQNLWVAELFIWNVI